MIGSGLGIALLVAVICSGVLGGAIAVVAIRRPQTPGRNAFVVLAVTLSGWCLFQALFWLSPPGVIAFAFDVLAATLALAGVFSWFVFAVQYTGHGEWLSRRRIGAIGAVVGAYFLATLTNPWHGLVRSNVRFASFESLTLIVSDIGPIGALTYALAYATILASYLLLARFALRSRPGYRMQTVTILLASIVPTLANVLYVAGFRPHPGLDPSPLFFLWMALVVGWALFRHDFLDVVPIATDLLIEEMEDPVFILDRDRRIVERNDATSDLLGDEGGRRLPNVFPELDEAVARGEGPVSTAAAGEERVYDVRSTSVGDQHGIDRGHLVVLRDVTEKRRRERELERQNEQLERFASVISHDLRNPLSTAYGYAELVRQGDEEAIDDVVWALEEMEGLIDDVLQLARDGRTVSDPEPVSIAETAEEAWTYVDSGETTLVVEDDVVIESDEGRLRELFGNLFRNAIEHGDADVVRLGPFDGDAPAGFFVEDDGLGIPPEDREEVFEPGYTTTGDGTGLGLAIVRTIARAHGWTVSIAEGIDGGTRFEFVSADGS
ncbi:MAG: histidine kinase N-terminal 7TM domain-containing protein [Halanaeroarchaeum sp.]